MPSLLHMLFSRSAKASWAWRRRGVRRRETFSAQFDGGQSSASHASLLGIDRLEARAMLAADDVLVSIVSNQVVLTLDPAGTAITDLRTSYAAKSGLLTITAATAG
ncbi:MAG: hypothetical protein K8S94_02320, partial [Planctomycetia bacterium]|nr:hypothetical protein [Planctomycetia bacterium]